jgi:hypothetical protein
MIDRFVTRLEKIGITVELVGNYPWIYLRKVNGKHITDNFRGNHGFTAFFLHKDGIARFSDRRKVFERIRAEVVGDNLKE